MVLFSPCDIVPHRCVIVVGTALVVNFRQSCPDSGGMQLICVVVAVHK